METSAESGSFSLPNNTIWFNGFFFFFLARYNSHSLQKDCNCLTCRSLQCKTQDVWE